MNSLHDALSAEGDERISQTCMRMMDVKKSAHSDTPFFVKRERIDPLVITELGESADVLYGMYIHLAVHQKKMWGCIKDRDTFCLQLDIYTFKLAVMSCFLSGLFDGVICLVHSWKDEGGFRDHYTDVVERMGEGHLNIIKHDFREKEPFASTYDCSSALYKEVYDVIMETDQFIQDQFFENSLRFIQMRTGDGEWRNVKKGHIALYMFNNKIHKHICKHNWGGRLCADCRTEWRETELSW